MNKGGSDTTNPLAWRLWDSRPLTHLLFWLGYYLLFSLIWVRPEIGYLGSFYLEFVLLPVRIGAVYCTLYLLLPQFLLQQRWWDFVLAYAALMIAAALLHRLSYSVFYAQLLLGQPEPWLDLAGLVRAAVLINTTVILLSALKVLQHYFAAAAQAQPQLQRIELRANRRTHLIDCKDIRYIEGLGNYVAYHLVDGSKLVAYGTIKAALEKLPPGFVRLHKSYIVNQQHIDSFSADDVQIGEVSLPRGKEVDDRALLSAT